MVAMYLRVIVAPNVSSRDCKVRSVRVPVVTAGAGARNGLASFLAGAAGRRTARTPPTATPPFARLPSAVSTLAAMAVKHLRYPRRGPTTTYRFPPWQSIVLASCGPRNRTPESGQAGRALQGRRTCGARARSPGSHDGSASRTGNYRRCLTGSGEACLRRDDRRLHRPRTSRTRPNERIDSLRAPLVSSVVTARSCPVRHLSS